MNILINCLDSHALAFGPLAKALEHGKSNTLCVVNSYLSNECIQDCIEYSIDHYQWAPAFHSCRLTGLPRSSSATSKKQKSISVSDLNTLDVLLLLRMFDRTIYSHDGPCLFDYYTNILIEYFDHILHVNNTDIVICYVFPHSYGDYVLNAVAKYYQLPVLGISPYADQHNGLFTKYDYTTSMYVEHSQILLNEYKDQTWRLLQFFLDGYKRDNSLPYSKDYIMQFDTDIEVSKRIILENIHTENALIATQLVRNIKQRITSKTAVIPHDKTHIIVFLAFEPEANLSPAGGINYDQLSFIYNINKLSDLLGITFFVKEHPFQLKLPTEDIRVLPQFSYSNFPKQNQYYNIIESCQCFGGYVSDYDMSAYNSDKQLIASVNGSILTQAKLSNKVIISGASSPLQNMLNTFYLTSRVDFTKLANSILSALSNIYSAPSFDTNSYANYFVGSNSFYQSKRSLTAAIDYSRFIMASY